MFEREMKVNFKSFVIWLLILLSIFLIAYLMYPSIINSDNVKMMDEMMSMFPKEILVALNMDISSMDSAYGWLKSEGFVLALLIISCYSGIMGSNILLKEENDKTIEYLTKDEAVKYLGNDYDSAGCSFEPLVVDTAKITTTRKTTTKKRKCINIKKPPKKEVF